jgi:hypothetical protein
MWEEVASYLLVRHFSFKKMESPKLLKKFKTHDTEMFLRGDNFEINDDLIKEFQNLTLLDLTYSSHFTDEGLSVLTNLKILNLTLDNGDIRGSVFKNLTNLKKLNLSQCNQNVKIQSTDLYHLTGLETLHMNHNRILDDSIFDYLISLKTLSCGGTSKITPNRINSLTNLTSLSLTDVNIHFENLVDFQLLTNLVHLNINYNSKFTRIYLSTHIYIYTHSHTRAHIPHSLTPLTSTFH